MGTIIGQTYFSIFINSTTGITFLVTLKKYPSILLDSSLIALLASRPNDLAAMPSCVCMSPSRESSLVLSAERNETKETFV